MLKHEKQKLYLVSITKTYIFILELGLIKKHE